ncbi:MAG: 2-oxoglutarate dehydrogenase E1 component [Pseudomonadota bacterium]|nr:2-oxoglutarate dehydrogenase E1 component [Pseudomonadota bacterium]
MKRIDEERRQSAFSALSMSYLDSLYEMYISGDKEEVDPSICAQFETFNENQSTEDLSHQAVIEKMRKSISHNRPARYSSVYNQYYFTALCERVIDWFECNGHYYSDIGMVNYPSIHKKPEKIDWSQLGLTSDDWSRPLPENLSITMPKGAVFSDLVDLLTGCFQSSIGYEYAHLISTEEKQWLREHVLNPIQFNHQQKKLLYELILKSEAFEHYLGRRYVGQKRFSLEGSESFIIALEHIISSSTNFGVKDVVIGMAHRGRLNTLVNILGFSLKEVDEWFQGIKNDTDSISGDVKYHFGYSSDRVFSGKPMHITLGFNPSHLESIVPVTMGSVRARQDDVSVDDASQMMPILIHGDASFAGQGVVAESLNMSYVNAYDVKGSIHVVINNQIGFTTLPDQSRSSYYCTDVIKSIRAPIFHVNGDDPEAVCRVALLASEYRCRFKKDVMIDIYSYRRHGHNEADEPMATSPLMYQDIKKKPSVVDAYLKHLMQASVLSHNDASLLKQRINALMGSGNSLVEYQNGVKSKREVEWSQFTVCDWDTPVDTSISAKLIRSLGIDLHQLPDGFCVQKQVLKMLDTRRKMFDGKLPMNWGAGESLLFASLLHQGISIRLVGQDSCRGTFSHRHSVLYDQNTGESMVPYMNIEKKSKSDFFIYNSTLSEFAAVGFEYGYSSSSPKSLVLWEAQFGDFANGAQVIIDQYLTSAWQKWGRMSGLVLLLPHGYEGQGPEHSSCRLERYLQMCAQNNIQVCVPSTPSQYFHLLRRQALRAFRSPLVVLTPKSFLRSPDAVSDLKCFTESKFSLIIDDDKMSEKLKVRRLVLCCGKVYYDLLNMRQAHHSVDVALCRIEQLYPFPRTVLRDLMNKYGSVQDVVWCQEEPKNQGCWYMLKDKIENCLTDVQKLTYVGRSKMAATATGDHSQHVSEQNALVSQALGIELD